jgi:hypothetical protein
MADIVFGSSSEEWSYSQATKTFDISGASLSKITIPTTQGPEGTSVAISPETSALVIVDMQNFFLDPKCMAHPNGLAAVEPTIKLISKCRELGIQVSNPLFHLDLSDIFVLGDMAQLGPNGCRHGHHAR